MDSSWLKYLHCNLQMQVMLTQICAVKVHTFGMIVDKQQKKVWKIHDHDESQAHDPPLYNSRQLEGTSKEPAREAGRQAVRLEWSRRV